MFKNVLGDYNAAFSCHWEFKLSKATHKNKQTKMYTWTKI